MDIHTNWTVDNCSVIAPRRLTMGEIWRALTKNTSKKNKMVHPEISLLSDITLKTFIDFDYFQGHSM